MIECAYPNTKHWNFLPKKLLTHKEGGKDTVFPWKAWKNEKKLHTHWHSSASISDNSCVFLFLKAEYNFITVSRAWLLSSPTGSSEFLASRAIRDRPLCLPEYKFPWIEDWHENEERELPCITWTFLGSFLGREILLQQL